MINHLHTPEFVKMMTLVLVNNTRIKLLLLPKVSKKYQESLHLLNQAIV